MYNYRRILPRGTVLVECGSSGDCLLQWVAKALGNEGGFLHFSLQQLAMEHLGANLVRYSDIQFTISDDKFQ